MIRKTILEALFYVNRPSLLEARKSDMFRRILTHSRESVPYYSSLNIVPNELDDKVIGGYLQKIPLLTKDIINERLDELVSQHKRRRTYWNASGGSTGHPVRIKQDQQYLACSRHITYEQKQLIGFSWGDRLVKIWGDDREIHKGKHSLREKLILHLKNTVLINSFQMSDDKKFAAIQEIKISSPKLIVSYVQSIYELACFAEDNNLSGFLVDSIIVSAGTLYPFMKEKIESVFGAPVYNRYGSREVGNIAVSTPSESGLIISKGVWVEVVDERGRAVPDGVEGEIVVTSLINYSMPLIRYCIGDRGKLGKRVDCQGRSFKVLENVTGRTVDIFTNESGDKIDGEYFTHLMYFRSWIKRFQFIQKDKDVIVVRIVPRSSPPEREINEIRRKVKLVMGEESQVKFDFVKEIVDPPSGKFRFTISEL